jgi:hypothetical protein
MLIFLIKKNNKNRKKKKLPEFRQLVWCDICYFCIIVEIITQDNKQTPEKKV